MLHNRTFHMKHNDVMKMKSQIREGKLCNYIGVINELKRKKKVRFIVHTID